MKPCVVVDTAQVIPLDESALESWRKEVDRARKTRKDASERFDWEGNLDRYAPKSVQSQKGQVNIGADFADVERKKAALFYAAPEISLVCDEPGQPLAQPQQAQPGQPATPTLGQLVQAHQGLLNDLIGPDHVDTKATVLKVIQDVLLVSGVGAVQTGYTAITQEMPVEVGVDPMTGQPIQQPAPIPIYEEFWASRISPAALLLPADFKDTDIRHAPWVGYDWRKPEKQVRAWLKLPEDFELPAGGEKPHLRPDEEPAGEGERLVSGTYIEYRPAFLGQTEHPNLVYVLVLVDGVDAPVKHEPSPNQTIDENGRLTPDSLPLFSIHPLWIRDLSDSAWVPSDSTITGPLTAELNTFRTQIVEQRDSAKQVILYDPTKLNPDARAKIEKGEINTFVPVEPEVLAGGVDAIMKQVATAQLGRESYLGQDYIAADRERILGISTNQNTGATNAKNRTATEISTIQRNTEARFNQEQARVLEWYLRVVRALDALALRHVDERMATMLLGPAKGKLWASFKAALLGGYRHNLRVDSGKYLDIEAERRQLLQFYQMVRQDPYIDPTPVLQKLVAAWGLPIDAIRPPQPKGPESPQASFSFKGDDLSALNPQFPLVIKIAQQGGWQISPQDVQAAQQHAQALQQIAAMLAPPAGAPGQPAPNEKHGGPATQQMPISKRQMDETGGISGPTGGVQ